MAGFTTPDTILDRVKQLLEQYLNAEVDNIDTHNNAVAGVSDENNFSTPDVADDDIQVYEDCLTARPIRVVVFEGRRIEDEEFQEYALDGSPSTLPRLDRSQEVIVSVRVDSTQGDWSRHGARRRCNRVAEAVRVIMGRFLRLSVPDADPALGGLVTDVDFAGDSVADEVTEGDWQHWRRDLTFKVRTIENRA